MMNLIKVKITPLSSFVTFPKGDTIFGHFAYHSFMQGEKIFEKYLEEEPKIIFSDILPDEYLYKPTLPLDAFGVDESDIKEFKKKSWIACEKLQSGTLNQAIELSFMKKNLKVRNSLNRVSFTTDDSGIFAPYSLEEITFVYQPVIYVLFDKTFTAKEIEDRLNEMGKNGFGKKGSIGKGHFKAEIDKEFQGFQELESDYYLTLSPTLLHNQKDIIDEAYYTPFHRFGKYHSTTTPYKKPLLMADSGAVVKLKKHQKYIGKAINNGIKTKSFVQGYSIIVPFKFDGKGL